MASPKSLIAVQLHRDAFNKQWGFRMQGGADQGQLLTIQRVFMQSPSEGILHRGDAVIRINDFDATRMTLPDAEQLVNNTALSLRMEVQRNNIGSNPTSPQPQSFQQGPPQFQRQTSQQYREYQQYQQEQQAKYQQAQAQTPAWQNSPTLQMIQQGNAGANRNAPRWEREQPVDDATTPAMRRLFDNERAKKTGVLEHTVPLPNLDKLSVTNQTYRSNQLITPGPKAKHFRPMGSYLGQSFGGSGNQSPRIMQDFNQFSAPQNTRSFNRGQPRPKSVYDQPGQYGNSLSPYGANSNGFQRPGSTSPQPQMIMGRQWPPKSPTPSSPPPSDGYAAGNPFQFGGAGHVQQSYRRPDGYQQPQQSVYSQAQQQIYGQPQQQQHGQLPFVIPQTQPGRKIVHSDYNSPAGLYSTQNAVDMFTGQTGLRPNQISGKGVPLTDFTQSPTYQLLQANQGQRGGTQWGHAPKQSRAFNSLDPSGLTEL